MNDDWNKKDVSDDNNARLFSITESVARLGYF